MMPPVVHHQAEDQQAWMKAAVGLGRRGLGNTGSNPSVGCIIVNNGIVVGQGWTQPDGRPHAEVMALDMAGPRARGADVFVTLEPCAHTGQTGPCAQALIDAGVSRVIVGVADPDPRVSGQGLSLLNAADIQVVVLDDADAAWNLFGFLKARTLGLPHVTLKLATTLDGKIALGHGESKWITGPRARQWGHLLRAQHDAIVTGARTVRADDPALSARLPGLVGQDPKPYILSSAEGLDGNFEILARAEVLCAKGAARLPDPEQVLRDLVAKGHTRVMIEAGSGVASLFMNAGLIDQIALFQAPAFIGRDGLNAVGSLTLGTLADMTRWDVLDTSEMGQERYLTLRRPNWREMVSEHV